MDLNLLVGLCATSKFCFFRILAVISESLSTYEIGFSSGCYFMCASVFVCCTLVMVVDGFYEVTWIAVFSKCFRDGRIHFSWLQWYCNVCR